MNKIICDYDYCTACYACANICPKNCIKLTSSSNSSLYPVIDTELCINCDLCRRICPSNNELAFNTPIKTYAAYSKSAQTNKNSTSGGIATELASKIISIGGIVYGSVMNSDLTVSVKRCITTDDLQLIQGSKYVHSHVNDAYLKILDDLQNGKTVLFISTPCQIAGLYSVIGNKKFETLYTADIICHGTPSQETFIQYAKYELGNRFNKTTNVTFRDKNSYVLKFKDEENNVIKSVPARASLYLNHFLDGYCFRKNCYKCKYAQPKRVSDITLGDFWNLGAQKPFNDTNNNGINLLLINSKKGEFLLDSIKNSIICYEREFQEALNGNQQLRSPEEYNDTARKFHKLIGNKNCLEALIKCNTKKYILICIRSYIYKHKKFHNFLNRIPIIKNKIKLS